MSLTSRTHAAQNAVRLFCLWVAITHLGGMASPAMAAASLELPMTAAQIQQAGIQISKISAANTGTALRLSGTAVLPNQALVLISAPAAAIVQKVWINALDTVQKGQPTVSLQSPQALEVQRDWIQADTQFRLAEQKLKRDDALLADGLISEQRMNETRGAFIQMQAQRKERAEALRLMGIAGTGGLSATIEMRAPEKASVVEVLATPGQRVEMGAPLVKLATRSPLILELQASKNQAAAIRVGDKVSVSGCSGAGRVDAVGSLVQTSNQTVLVRAQIPADCAKPGEYVQAMLDTAYKSEVQAWTIPLAALAKNGKGFAVFKATAKGFAIEPVELLSKDGQQALVTGALASGDKVATQGIGILKGMAAGLGGEAQ